jgi:hypothetical protein
MTAALPNEVRVTMANREHRMRHLLWHGVRNRWLQLSSSDKQKIRHIDPAWEPPRPARDAADNVLRANDSGEDFLYMHRQMIVAVNDILAGVGDPNYPKVKGWKQVPPPGDRDYPVPPSPFPSLEGVKSDDYYNRTLALWERQYKSREYLKSVTLGLLGADLEFTIHNAMHMRWAAVSPIGYRPGGPITQPVAPKWDDPAYDYLGDTYSSHVNPIFWKLHGWVDDRVEDWKRAQRIINIEWRGTWVGPMAHAHHPHSVMALSPTVRRSENEVEKLERLTTVLSEATGFDGFFQASAPPRSEAEALSP